ncbi:MAG: hypothetical protein CW338_02120 [Clostridiales bacterium]|nr:hypothetical protein [Clostridiales bacterium]
MLNKINALELNENELMNAAGGNWLTDAWDATCDACSTAWDATCDFCAEHKKEIAMTAMVVGGFALCAVGGGLFVLGATVATQVTGGVLMGAALADAAGALVVKNVMEDDK